MQAHEQRVVDERNELDIKVSALRVFSTSELFASLPFAERHLLSVQLEQMVAYSETLKLRIARFN